MVGAATASQQPVMSTQRSARKQAGPQVAGVYAAELFFRLGFVVRHLKRCIVNAFLHGTTANALRANADGFACAIFRCNFHPLQVRLKCAAGQTGDFRTESAEVFCLTTRGHLISECPPFSATFTNSRHFTKSPIKQKVYFLRRSSGICDFSTNINTPVAAY